MSISGHSQQTIKICFLGTLSGSASALGQDQDDAFMLVVMKFVAEFLTARMLRAVALLRLAGDEFQCVET